MSTAKGASRGVVARPVARYRPGRLPEGADLAAEAALLDSDEEDDGRERGRPDEAAHELDGAAEAITSFGAGARQGVSGVRKPAVKVELSQVKIGKAPNAVPAGYDSDEYETDTDDEPAPAKPTFRKPGPGVAQAHAQPVKSQADESSEYETDSEEEESEDEPPPLLKPVFVPKRLRATTAAKVDADAEKESAEAKALKAAQARKEQSHLLAAETIKRELLEKEHEENVPDLSDTDGKDPEAEFQAWRLRELQRIKRSREAEAERERELEEIERRRQMPEEQRLAEDLKRAQESRDAKPKGQQRFMQKYYHKGAFFQDMDVLKKHDFTEATESQVDVQSLPKLMQVRDYGKRSRSKWTHLANEDTSKRQEDVRFQGFSAEFKGGPTAGSSGGLGPSCFVCGGPHLKRDCPQAHGRGGAHDGDRVTGSNRGSLGSSSRWQPADSASSSKRYRDREAERDREAAEERAFDDRRRERRPSPPRRDVFDGPDRDFERRRDERMAGRGYGDDGKRWHPSSRRREGYEKEEEEEDDERDERAAMARRRRDGETTVGETHTSRRRDETERRHSERR